MDNRIKTHKYSILENIIKNLLFLTFIFISGFSIAYSQNVYQSNYFSPNQPASNYLLNSSAFKQEIARFEINVVRQGKDTLPLTQVPRLEKDDILKVRLLDEQVNGMKPDQSNWNWSFVVAYINPTRNNEKEKSVSEEIQFRKTGWYREYTFVVPYDCQPIFFVYSKPNYRNKILRLVSKNQEELRKVGEKTLELAGAYAKIGSFLNELQYVINGGASMYGGYGGYGVYNGSGYGGYGASYGGYSSYGGYYGNYNNYNSYGTNGSTDFNLNLFMNQTVESLARSFNIQLPQSCWQGGMYGYNNSYNTYNNYGNQGNPGGVSPEFIARAQCVAKNVRLEDFDISVSRMLQQGGLVAVAQLTQKYPQLTFWINLAAAALDFIVKISKKSPLRIVPAVTSSGDNPAQNFGYQNSFALSQNATPQGGRPPVKISLFAESPPNDNGFVTAYPLVVTKWQPNPDPEVISLPTPILANQCLHPGQNVLKSTDVINDWMADNFTTDFMLVVQSSNGFRKEFPLKKNLGVNGWDLSLTKEDLNSFPKINMTLESFVTGKRGFNEIRSPKFDLPIPLGNNWEIDTNAKQTFATGGKRVVTLKNKMGSCKCLQTVVYKPSFGGEFIFDSNNKNNPLVFSADGAEASFEMDTTNFPAGQGQLELRQIGGEVANLPLNLYPAPPAVTDLKMARGDKQVVIYGERLEQIQALTINGKRAVIVGNSESEQNNADKNQAKSEKVFAFADANEKLLANTVTLVLMLDENRTYQIPKTFNASLARPTIVANSANEVEAVAINKMTEATAAPDKKQLSLEGLPVFPVKTSEVFVIVQNALTDYDFKVENIQIETKIENSQIASSELPKVDFEVLDQNKMRLSFPITEQTQRFLAGRRLQFRIRDRARGNSDWYTLQKTFVRTPENISVKCAAEMKGQCELSGEGIEYISSVSVDGGKTWFPEQPATLMVQPKVDGRKVAMIPFVSNRELLQIKLGDFPAGPSLTINDYKSSNPTMPKNLAASKFVKSKRLTSFGRKHKKKSIVAYVR